MTRKSLTVSFICGLAALVFATTALGQQTVISAGRIVNWSLAGAPSIANRTTQCGNTIAAYSGTAATINNAIAACPGGQFVQLGPGTFTLSTGISINHDNITIRGAGPQGASNGGTDLTFTGYDGCGGLQADVCLTSTSSWYSGNATSTSWTAGYAKGTTTLTFSSTAGLAVGRNVLLDQINDTDSDTGSIWICGTTNVCTTNGGGAQSSTGSCCTAATRAQQQLVLVTAINGTTVTVTPGLYMPNWRSSQTPKAFWGEQPVTGVGIENLAMDHTASGKIGIAFLNAWNSWVKNVKSYKAGRAHVQFYQSAHNTIRDSYFDEDASHASQAYGIESFIGSDNLIENNILHHITLPVAINGTASGTVIAYNYLYDNTYSQSPSWMIAGYGLHEAGLDNVLFEGNDGPGFIADVVHGTHHFITLFRNRFAGVETNKTQQTTPIYLYAYSRYYNIVGNVLGTSGYHNNYECAPTIVTTTNCSPNGDINHTLGWSGNDNSGSTNNDTLPELP